MLITEMLKALLVWALLALAVWLFTAWNVYLVESNRENPKNASGFLIGQSLVIGLILSQWFSAALKCA